MRVAIANLILATPNIRPQLILEEVEPISATSLREVNIVELGKALADRGHDVVVYAAEGFLRHGDEHIGDRLVVRAVPTVLSRVFHPALFPLGPELPRLIKRDHPDVIQADEFHQPATYLASRAAKEAGIPLVVWQEIFHRMRAPGSFYEHAYESSVGREVCRTASRFVPRTTRARGFLQRIGIPRSRIGPWVPTGIDTELFRPRESPLTPEGFGFGKDTTVILVVARLNPDKRVDLAIQAVALLRKKGRDVGLVIRGSGPLEAELRQLARRLGIEDRVHFLGRMTRNELVDIYNASDIFLLTSRRDIELLPFAIIQAAACGLAIVSVQAGSVGDVVHHGVNGAIVRDETPEGVAAGLQVFLDDEEARRTMGHRSRLRAEELFDLRVVAQKLEGVYREARKAA